ncbi:GNAT family N-acetyltransferase [Photobacterium sp. GJ3]|uniref:GNAT family N-acetyltransferase n=1 Tax=Photobacterium sp. GJ3 TaxID=2829502 RepID=UPI001B8D45D4|nr:GNAT family N-acetyltransferase [Photobacterium sp. GJ3]QUJ67872.1 GNAT family N-acetyltransferase [Photobacterium sp. GJ3]
MKTQLKKIEPIDIKEVANLHLRSWLLAYKALLPKAMLDHLTVEKKIQSWESILDNNQIHAIASVTEGKISGFVCFGMSRDSDKNREEGELIAIYIDPLFLRQGIGSILIDHVKHEMRSLGYRSISLWVLKGNISAKLFYHQHGFNCVHTSRELTFWGHEISEFRMKVTI